MSIPTTREEFSQYCLRKLGEPVIQINVSVEQVDDRISEALYKFYERNYQAVEECFLLINITDDQVSAGYITLPSDVVGVTDVLNPASSSGVYSAEYQFNVSQIYAMLNTSTLTAGGMSYYYMTASHMQLLNRFFSPSKSYDFNSITNKLIIAGGLKDTNYTYGGIIVRGFRKIHGEANTDDPSNTIIYNIWQNKWLQNYATALIKRQWGQNLSKFQNVQFLGGITMNGDQIKQEAKEEIDQLEEQLLLEYELPPCGFMA